MIAADRREQGHLITAVCSACDGVRRHVVVQVIGFDRDGEGLLTLVQHKSGLPAIAPQGSLYLTPYHYPVCQGCDANVRVIL